MYIERQLEKKFIAVSEEYACVLLTGPRQVGKSTMLRHLMEGTARAEVSLDDLEERRLAKTDPAMFLKLHPAPVLIDEVSSDGAGTGVAGRKNRHSSYVGTVTVGALRCNGGFTLFVGA